MIREERNPAFWADIAAHPALLGATFGLPPEALGRWAITEPILPLAALHGGFLFVRLDAFGFVRELHTLFTPEGWGREVALSAKAALDVLFAGPCRILTTYEMRDNPRSRPPTGFGSIVMGDWQDTAFGEARPWLLTMDAWLASPAFRRLH